MWYTVFDFDFKRVGFVNAVTAEQALEEAKKKFPLVVAPMVELEKQTDQTMRGYAQMN